jgi:hypothetical protein
MLIRRVPANATAMLQRTNDLNQVPSEILLMLLLPPSDLSAYWLKPDDKEFMFRSFPDTRFRCWVIASPRRLNLSVPIAGRQLLRWSVGSFAFTTTTDKHGPLTGDTPFFTFLEGCFVIGQMSGANSGQLSRNGQLSFVS